MKKVVERIYLLMSAPKEYSRSSGLAWCMGPILQELGHPRATSLSGIERGIKRLNERERAVLLKGAIKTWGLIKKLTAEKEDRTENEQG